MKDTQLPIIHIDLISHGNGTFNAYLSSDNSSGANYDNISADVVGKYVADMICDIDQNETDTTHETTQPCILIHTDGYTVDKYDFNNKEDACQKMKQEYTELYDAVFGKDGPDSDNTSHIDTYEADLYTGSDVHLWRIYNI